MTSLVRHLLLLLALATPQFAVADLYDDYINSTSKQHYVDFLARTGVPGHAFVRLRVAVREDLTISLRTFGLYPESGKLSQMKAVFSRTSGRIDMEFADMEWNIRHSRPVTEEQLRKLLDVYKKWASDAPKYSLLNNGGLNCNSFVGEVAKALEMNVPEGPGSTLPTLYIMKLAEINK